MCRPTSVDLNDHTGHQRHFGGAVAAPKPNLSTIVFAELYFGAYLIQDAVRRDGLVQSISRIRAEFSGRTLVFGDMPAEQNGRITAARRLAGRPVETKDAMIAAICLTHGATLATRNVRDFDGLDLKLINPFEADS